MKGHIPREKIEEIRNRADIVALISEYVSLKKAGRNFIGLCPFHQEKTPSFTVNPDKQIFYCFGCEEGGNIFSFLMKINNMTFPEAVGHLASKMGIAIETEENYDKREIGEREKLLKINSMAMKYFSQQLSSEAGKTVRGYLQKRGMKDSIVKDFYMGYSPDGWENLKNFLGARKVPLGLAEKAGLLTSRQSGGYYDRFRGRLMFPIEDLSGNIIAFGGRIMGDGEPKYLNSPESPVYTKGKNLYGLQKAKNSIRENDGVIIVEGYMDFLSLWGCGFTNVVAVLGTALTKDQVALIRRFTKNVFIVFDPDEAGKIAVERSMKLFLEEEMHAKVIILPEGYDPDDYVKKFGRDAFSNAITQAPSMIDYYIEKVLGGKATFEENMDSVRNSISFMRNISNPVQRNLFIKRVSEKLGVDQRQLKAEINKDLRESSYSKSGGFDTKKAVNVDAAELNLVYMMVEYPEKVAIAAEKKVLDYFIDPNLKKLGESIEKFFKDGEKDMSGLIADLPDDAVKDRLLKLMVSESPFDDVTIDRAFADTARSIKTKWYKNRHNVLKKELFDAQKTGDKELCGKLLIEKEQLLKEERGISNG